MKRAVVEHQHPVGSGSRSGSWDPVGVWGADGGRIYSTAMVVLALEAPCRYVSPAPSEHLGRVVATLREIASDPDPVLAKAAEEVLAQLATSPPQPAPQPDVQEISYYQWRARCRRLVDRGDWISAWALVRDATKRPFLFDGRVSSRAGRTVRVMINGRVHDFTVSNEDLLRDLGTGTRVAVLGYVTTSAGSAEELRRVGTQLRMEVGWIRD